MNKAASALFKSLPFVAKTSSSEPNIRSSISQAATPASKLRRSLDVGASMAKTVATLGALTCAIPLSLSLLTVDLCVSGIRAMIGSDEPDRFGHSRLTTGKTKTVLLSGGKMSKALQLARSLHADGHRVILIESYKYWLTGHRFSNAVDRFYTVPTPGAPGYVQALIDIIKREHVDVYIPVCSPVASLHDAAALPALSHYCEVIHVGPDRIDKLDDKYTFAQTAASLQLAAPKSVRVTDPSDVLDFDFSAEQRQFILKSIRYDSIRRLNLTKLPCATPEETEAFVRSLPISPDNPWVMQEFIPGTEYCTHGTFRDGELRVHCCCRSSPFQINYQNDDVPEIEQWAKRFGEALALTGQASIDFIHADDDGRIYAIECNPRTHSAITMFYNHPELAAAYLGGPLSANPITPLASSRPTYWFYHEIWRLITSLASPKRFVDRLRIIARGKDAVLDWRDPLPFFMLHHWHIPLLLLRDLRERRGWLKIDFNIGKLVQLGGD